MKKTLVNLVINIFSFIEGKTSKLERMGYFFKYNDNNLALEEVYIFPFEFIRVEAEAQKFHFIKFKPLHKNIKHLE